ncbi:hypothetical protein [Marinobacter sp. BGYM27]|uniref:hypothetical protein n=1 Tax=Marinobacter sp. BGYM27 TaxID=2975597 RepID=UPI0021A942D3|nr:hypothetical protein [Marinobacter sp. BGYM27]MDG5498978.1 hypothetical protein [Marinobacter sp. BGYM27]
MIELFVSEGVGVISGRRYPIKVSYLANLDVVYAQWAEGQSFYEREPFAGKELDVAVMGYVQGAAAEVRTAHENRGLPVPPANGDELDIERSRMIVSRFQARAALYGAGLLANADAAIQGADDLAKLAWNDAQEFRRNSPLVAAIAAELGITDLQLDDLFRQASIIEA